MLLALEVQDLAQPGHLQTLFMPQTNAALLVPGNPPGLLLDTEKGHFTIQTACEMLPMAPARREPMPVRRARKQLKPAALRHAHHGAGHTLGLSDRGMSSWWVTASQRQC